MQAPSSKTLALAAASMALAPAAVVSQSCPVDSFDGFDFSQVMSYCGDLGSTEGCDRCFSGLLSPIVSTLDYIPVDENTTCDSFGTTVADTLSGCQDAFSSAIQGQLGFRAAGLLGLRNCDFDFQQYGQTSGVAINYYNSKGIDIAAICANN